MRGNNRVGNRKKVVCEELSISLLGPADASRARVRFAEEVLRGALADVSRGINQGCIPQMKGFCVKVFNLAGMFRK